MKSYPPEIDELMARCLTGESSQEDIVRFNLLLSDDEGLKADYETLKLLMFNRCDGSSSDNDLKQKLKRISRRLEDDGLM